MAIICLAIQPGCAHKVHKNINPQTGKTAIIINYVPSKESFEIPGTGRLADAGRGAASGSVLGGGAGLVCHMAAIICMPVFATVGAIGGAAAYGAVKAEPSSLWSNAEDSFRGVLAEDKIEQSLAKGIETYAQEYGHDLIVQSDRIKLETKGVILSNALAAEGFDTYLEINDTTVILVPAEMAVDPPRKFTLLTHVRLIRTADNSTLVDRIISDDLGKTKPVEDWMANNAQAFREEIPLALQRLAKKIFTEIFLLHRFPEQTVHWGPMVDIHLIGLKPISPTFNSGNPPFLPPEIDSLRPTLEWEPFVGDNVTYDLRIWRSTFRNIGEIIYNRERIVGARYSLDTPLEPSTTYFWSVRVHFLQEGKVKVTDWSKYSLILNKKSNILTMGTGNLLMHLISDSFFQFKTPQTQ